MRIHSVHKLIEHRVNTSTKRFNARGSKVSRCQYCQIDKKYCICEYQPHVTCDIAVVLLMSENEVLKPSNTGRLIADVVRETYTYQWNRTEPDKALLDLLVSPDYMPLLVFPEEYVEQPSRLFSGSIMDKAGQSKKTPLFIFLDGSWREARKMFRKSPYLDGIPVLSLTPDSVSEYIMRKSENENHLSTAEVASLVLANANQDVAATVLQEWFEVFRESYMLSKTRIRSDYTRPVLQKYLHNAAQDNESRKQNMS